MSRSRALVVTCLLALPLAASETLWRDVASDAVPQTGERQIVPARYRLLFLDTAAFRSLAATAPREGTDAAPPAIALPLPDGSFSRFALHEAPILDAALAARLAEVRTWRVQGLDDPAATGSLDWTPAGFHAFILSPAGSVYIDPYTPGRTDYYISYWRSDYARPAAKQFQCEVMNDEVSEPRLTTESDAVVSDLATGPTLRTFRLAVAATGEYTYFHGGVAGAQAAIVTTINRVNAIFERDVAVRMTLVNNSSIVFPSPYSDPYQNNKNDFVTNQSVLDEKIGGANYDVGHLFLTAGGGVAALGSVCAASGKALGVSGIANPVGDPFDVDYVAHEIGHQFGAEHTFNGTDGSCGGSREPSSAYEPGSGSTVMAYAGICFDEDLQPHSDPYFHTKNLDEIASLLAIRTCGAQTSTGNTPPSVTPGPTVTIPKSTPFYLTGAATDPNGDTLTYNWEQFDLGNPSPPNTDDGSRPIFRSFNATTSPSRTFPRFYDLLFGADTIGESLPTTTRTMTFRLTVRDNRAGGGGVSYGTRNVQVSATSGPFVVTYPNLPIGQIERVSWPAGSTQTVTWNVAATTAPPVSCANVKILLSVDGGYTYLAVLAASTPNDGAQAVVVPFLPTTLARVRVECATSPFFDVSNFDFTIRQTINVVATATSATNVLVSWSAIAGAVSYDVYRRSGSGGFVKIGSTTATSYNDSTAAADTAYFYAMRSVDGAGNVAALSNPDLAITIPFTDPVLTPGITIKAVHLLQLRAAIDALRGLIPQGPYYGWEEDLLAGGTIRSGHIGTIKGILIQTRQTLGLPALTFVDPTYNFDMPVKAMHLNELRAGLQ